MAIFKPNHGLTPLEKCQFFDFWTSCFHSVEKPFFVLEYRKRHFRALYCLKRKLAKWPFLDQNHGLTPLEKCQFFDFWTSGFYSVERPFFVLEYRERHFSGQHCLKKKKFGKMAIFGPKPWVDPFKKISIFRLFEPLVFIA